MRSSWTLHAVAWKINELFKRLYAWWSRHQFFFQTVTFWLGIDAIFLLFRVSLFRQTCRAFSAVTYFCLPVGAWVRNIHFMDTCYKQQNIRHAFLITLISFAKQYPLPVYFHSLASSPRQSPAVVVVLLPRTTSFLVVCRESCIGCLVFLFDEPRLFKGPEWLHVCQGRL